MRVALTNRNVRQSGDGRLLSGALAALCVAILLSACSGVRKSQQPMYEGLPLSAWLRLKGTNQPELHNSAIDAIRQAGTNGLPIMLEMLQSEDPNTRAAALGGFELLGAQAAPALSVLATLLVKSNTADAALAAMLCIGPPSLPVLRVELTNESSSVRALAANGLGRLHGPRRWPRGGSKADPELDKTVIVPLLLQLTLDWDRNVRRSAKVALAGVSGRTPEAIPIILSTWTAYLADQDAAVRGYAAESIFRTLPEFESIVPALIKLLDDPSEEVREKGAAAFREVARTEAWTNRYPDLAERLYAIEWGPALAQRPKELPPDDEIRRRLPGTWIWERSQDNGVLEKGSLVIFPDGAFFSQWSNTRPGQQAGTYTFEGTWQVRNGYWITRSSAYVVHSRILRVDDTEFVSRCEGIESNGLLDRPTRSEASKLTRAK